MEVTVRHAPSFAAARLSLDGGEAVRVEAGAMMATSSGVGVEAKMEGGLLRSLKRAVAGGESLFVTTYTAPAGGGWVDVAANLPGDVIVSPVENERPLFVTRGSWVASSAGVELDTKWGGFKSLFGGEGGFLLRAAGAGSIVVACYGALDTVTLAAGEQVVVDSGHVVAYSHDVMMQLRRVTGGAIQSMKSGEGLVFAFTGPGWVMTQTRNPNALVQWLTSVLPFSRQ